MHIAIYMYIYIYVSLSTSVEYSGGRANIERTFENRYFHVSKLNVTLTQMGQMGEVYRGGDGLLGRVDGVAAMFFFFFFFFRCRYIDGRIHRCRLAWEFIFILDLYFTMVNRNLFDV